MVILGTCEVTVIARVLCATAQSDSGVVARGEWFEDEAAARRRPYELSADAAALDAAAFRARYRLPP